MSTKYKIKSLSYLNKVVKVKDKAIYIDSMRLFTRLMIIGERELSLNESLSYELTHMPTSLFNNKQKMRKTNKAVLANNFKKRVSDVCVKDVKVTVIDGGWLMHQVQWDDGKTYGGIAEQYAKFVQYIGMYDRAEEIKVIFDGYHHSNKDHEHGRRSGKAFSEVEVSWNKRVMTSRKKIHWQL